jgi:lipopolysaccharide transport system ATP-binding protein
MERSVIDVQQLSKQYIIGGAANRGDTFREAVTSALGAPFRRRQPRGSQEQFWALKDVSFHVKEGEILGIIGRNGAGKSTLLKILSRITEPTEGRCYIRGRVASLLEVGTGFHPELTGRENIYLNGAILGMSRSEIRRQFDSIVAFAEVEKFIDTPVKRYSSGMYVRLAFSVASHLEPDVLIVDEVLAVGDAGFQAKCLNRLGSSSNAGRTTLFVSHNLAAIQELCKSAIVLERGKISFLGAANDAVSHYLAAFRDTPAGLATMWGPLKTDVEINTLEVLQDCEPTTLLSSKKPTTIRIEGTVRRDFRDLSLSIGIWRDRALLFNCYDAPFGTGIRAGAFTAQYLLPRYIFRPGRYIISFWARRNDGGDWLRGSDILCFEVAQEWDAVNRAFDEGVAVVPYEGQRLQNGCQDYPALRHPLMVVE